MKHTETTVERQRKPSKWVAIISAALLLLAIIASILLGVKTPKSSVIASPSGKITSMATVGEDVYISNDNGEIFRIDDHGRVAIEFDLHGYMKTNNMISYDTEGNEIVTKITNVQTETNSDNIWAVTANRYLFRLVEKDDAIEVVDYYQLKDGLQGLTEKGGYVYILETDVNFGWLKKFDLTKNFSEGPVSSGHLYLATRAGQTVTLEHAQNLGQVSFEIIEADYTEEDSEGNEVTVKKEYAYILHTTGLLRVATDCTQNKWRERYLERYNVIYQEMMDNEFEARCNEAVANLLADNSNPSDSDRAAARATAEKDVKNIIGINATKAASNQLVDDFPDDLITDDEDGDGFKDGYDGRTGVVKVKHSTFDYQAYNAFMPANSEIYRGAAYIANENKYYIVTGGGKIVTCDATNQEVFGRKRFNEALTHGEADIATPDGSSNAQLPYMPTSLGSTFFYDKTLNVGYVTYENEKMVSRIDFDSKEITFTAALDFHIQSLIQSTDDNTIFYTYTNVYEADVGELILRMATTDGREIQTTLETLYTLAIVFAVCMAVVLTFALLCLFRKGFSPKFMDVMYGVKKQWVIYLIILATMSLVGLFCFYPAIGSISLSFFDYTEQNPERLWNHFAHYKKIFTDSKILSDFGNMFLFLASDLFIALLPPLIFAFFLTIMRNKNYSALTRTLLFIPGIIPGVATTLLWREGIYGMNGVLNTFIGFLTGESSRIRFLIDPDRPWLVKLSLIMMGFPFVGSYLIFYGAMMNVPDSYYEAAELDGITVIKRFVFIDVPLIFAQIKYVFIMTFIGSVQNFGRTYMTETADWGVKTPVHEMYLLINDQGNYGQASAYATILFIFLFFATMINMRVQTKDNQVA